MWVLVVGSGSAGRVRGERLLGAKLELDPVPGLALRPLFGPANLRAQRLPIEVRIAEQDVAQAPEVAVSSRDELHSVTAADPLLVALERPRRDEGAHAHLQVDRSRTARGHTSRARIRVAVLPQGSDEFAANSECIRGGRRQRVRLPRRDGNTAAAPWNPELGSASVTLSSCPSERRAAVSIERPES
jgi:hypothetical protein